MSMHYDLQAAEAGIRASIAAMPLPPEASALAKVMHRNREVSIQLMLLALAENNRGSDALLITEAVAAFAAEFMISFMMPYDDGERLLVVERFEGTFNRMLNNGLAGRLGAVAATDLVREPGGHA